MVEAEAVVFVFVPRVLQAFEGDAESVDGQFGVWVVFGMFGVLGVWG